MPRRARVPKGEDVFSQDAASPRPARVVEGKELFFKPPAAVRRHPPRPEGAAEKNLPGAAPGPPADPGGRSLVGRRLGPFLVTAELGRGATGVVYRAEQGERGPEVALRVFHPWLVDQTGFAEALRRELSAVANLRHLNISRLQAVEQIGDLHLVVADLPPGKPLDRLLRQSGQLSPEQAIRIAIQVAVALDYAHANGVVHGGVKPANVLVGPDDRVTVVDFCLRRVADEVMQRTSAGALLGTPEYLAPEQVEGRPVGAAADRYAFAALLCELLTGQPPFRSETPLGVLVQQASGEPPRVSQRRPDLPAALDDVFARGLAKDPALRPTTCAGLVREVAATLRGDAGAVSQALAPSRPRGGRWLAVVLVAVALLGVMALAWEGLSVLSPRLERYVQAGVGWLVPTPTPGPQVMGTEGGRSSPASILAPAGATSPAETPTAASATPATAAPVATAGVPPIATASPAAGTPTPPAVVSLPQGTLVLPRLADNGANRLFLYSLADRSLKQLTSEGSAWEWAPAPSPDGQWIAFASGAPSRAEIVVIKRDGSAQRIVAHAGGLVLNSPWWTPDGRIIFEGTWNGRSEIYSVAPDRGDVVQLTRTAGVVDETRVPTWAAVGGSLVFSGKQGGLFKVFTQPPDGTPKAISPAGANAFTPAVSPDGTRIAFSGTLADGQVGVFTMGADGAGVRRLATPASGTWVCCPSWSPDGRWLAYVGNLGVGASPSHGDVFVVAEKGGEPIRVTDDGRTYNWRPVWLP